MLPYLTAALSAVFAVAVAMRYARSRRAALLAWAVGLAMFAVAAAAEGIAQSGQPTDVGYKVFYLLGGILNVAWLGVGTVLLVAPRFGRAAVIAALVLSVLGLYAVAVSPVDMSEALSTGKGFNDSPLPRVLAGIGSGVGSLVLIGGALWSAWVFFRRRHNGRRAVSNVIIAAGVLIVAAGGTATFIGGNGILEYTNLIGVAVMFAGFLLA
jgi:hypothetical protein